MADCPGVIVVDACETVNEVELLLAK